MSLALLEAASRALEAHGGIQRLVSLARQPARTLTPAQAAAALRDLAAQGGALVGWWQDPDALSHTGLGGPLPDEAAMACLLEGEWSAGAATLQLRRMGSHLLQASVVELASGDSAPAGADMQPALAQEHRLMGRADLRANSIRVTVYSVWDDQRQQVVPVAQRLISIADAD